MLKFFSVKSAESMSVSKNIIWCKRISVLLCASYCFIEALNSTQLDELISENILSLVKYAVAIISVGFLIVSQREKIFERHPCVVFFALVVAAGTLICARTTQITMLVVYILLLRDYNFKEILYVLYLTLWMLFIVTVFLYVINIYPHDVYMRGEEFRYSLGFGTPTLGQSVILFLFLSKFYLKNNKLSYFSIAFYTVLSFVFYIFTSGRAAFFLFVFALIFVVAYKIFSRKYSQLVTKILKNHFFKILITSLPFIFLFLSLFFTHLYAIGTDIGQKLNSILSTRLVLQLNAFKERPITLFGQEIQWVNSHGIYIGIDNGILYNLFNNGLVVFACVLIAYSFMLNRAVTVKRDLCLIIVIFVILMDSLAEPYIIDFKYNYFIFYIGNLFFNKQQIIPLDTSKFRRDLISETGVRHE